MADILSLLRIKLQFSLILLFAYCRVFLPRQTSACAFFLGIPECQKTSFLWHTWRIMAKQTFFCQARNMLLGFRSKAYQCVAISPRNFIRSQESPCLIFFNRPKFFLLTRDFNFEEDLHEYPINLPKKICIHLATKKNILRSFHRTFLL